MIRTLIHTKTCKAIITQNQIGQFARIVGDFNPVHIDPKKAAETRFGGIISHGMLGLGYTQSLLFPYEIDRMEIKFVKPMRPGDEITVKV